MPKIKRFRLSGLSRRGYRVGCKGLIRTPDKASALSKKSSAPRGTVKP
jgi:hypothetical protein